MTAADPAEVLEVVDGGDPLGDGVVVEVRLQRDLALGLRVVARGRGGHDDLRRAVRRQVAHQGQEERGVRHVRGRDR